VAVGLVYAARVADALERIDSARVAAHDEVVRSYGLRAALPAGLDPDVLIELMARDKKVVDAGLTFVLDGPDGVETVPGVSESIARAALAAMPR
jgi:5-deoxy-5-amino-3-dehydroquinate synthase